MVINKLFFKDKSSVFETEDLSLFFKSTINDYETILPIPKFPTSLHRAAIFTKRH